LALGCNDGKRLGAVVGRSVAATEGLRELTDGRLEGEREARTAIEPPCPTDRKESCETVGERDGYNVVGANVSPTRVGVCDKGEWLGYSVGRRVGARGIDFPVSLLSTVVTTAEGEPENSTNAGTTSKPVVDVAPRPDATTVKGATVGMIVGTRVGIAVGELVVLCVGDPVGLLVGLALGCMVGKVVGGFVGRRVGPDEGN